MNKFVRYAISIICVLIGVGSIIAYRYDRLTGIHLLFIICITITVLSIFIGAVISSFIQPHKRFTDKHRSWFSIHEQNDVRRMWILFGISLFVILSLFSVALSYVLLEKPENRTGAYTTGFTFLVGLILNLTIYYWSFGTNLAQMRATRLIENLMTGITTLGEDTLEQLLRLREYLDIRKRENSDNWLRMAVASPAFGILHSPEAIESFLHILEDWLAAAEVSTNNQLELIFWSRVEHRKDFGAKNTNLPAWDEKRQETIGVLCRLALILARIQTLQRDDMKNVNVKIWESRRSDYRICIAGPPSSTMVRAALILYAPLDKELCTGATKVDSLFFQYHKGQGKNSLITMYERHKSQAMGANSINPESYLNDPLLFLEDFFEISEEDKKIIHNHLSANVKNVVSAETVN